MKFIKLSIFYLMQKYIHQRNIILEEVYLGRSLSWKKFMLLIIVKTKVKSKFYNISQRIFSMGQKQFTHLQQAMESLRHKIVNKYQIKYSQEGYPYYISDIETNMKYSLRCLSFKTQSQQLKISTELQRRKKHIYDKNPCIIGFQEIFPCEENKIIDKNFYQIFLLVSKPQHHLQQFFCQYLQSASQTKQAKQKVNQIPETQLWNILLGFITAMSCLQKNRIVFGAVRSTNIIYDYPHSSKYKNLNRIVQIHDPITNQSHQTPFTNFSLAKENKKIYDQSTCNICIGYDRLQIEIGGGIIYEKIATNYLSPQQIEALNSSLSEDSYDKYKSDVYVFGYMIVQFLWNYYISQIKKQQKWEFDESNQYKNSIQRIKFKTGITCSTKAQNREKRHNLFIRKLWIIRKKLREQYNYQYSQQLYSLLEKMLRDDPKQRHNWIQLYRIVECSQEIQLIISGKINKNLFNLKQYNDNLQYPRTNRIQTDCKQQKEYKIYQERSNQEKKHIVSYNSMQFLNYPIISNSTYKIRQKKAWESINQMPVYDKEQLKQTNFNVDSGNSQRQLKRCLTQINSQIKNSNKKPINLSGRTTTNDAFTQGQKSIIVLGKLKSKSSKNLLNNAKLGTITQSVQYSNTGKKMTKSYSQHQSVAIPALKAQKCYKQCYYRAQEFPNQQKKQNQACQLPFYSYNKTLNKPVINTKEHKFNLKQNNSQATQNFSSASYQFKSKDFTDKKLKQDKVTFDQIMEKVKQIKSQFQRETQIYQQQTSKQTNQWLPISLANNKNQKLNLNQIAQSISSHSNNAFFNSEFGDKQKIDWHQQKSKTSRKVSVIDQQLQKGYQQPPMVRSSVKYQICFTNKREEKKLIQIQINETDEYFQNQHKIIQKPYSQYAKLRSKSDNYQENQKIYHLRSYSSNINCYRKQYKSQILKIAQKRNQSKSYKNSRISNNLKDKLQTEQQSVKNNILVPDVSEMIQILYPNGSYYFGQINQKDNSKQGYGELVYPLQLLNAQHRPDCNSKFKHIKFTSQDDNLCHCYIRRCAYIGQWHQNCFNGYGHLFNDLFDSQQEVDYRQINLTENNWQKYFGEFKMDIRQGFGQLHFGNEIYYVGQFKDNVIDGQGSFCMKQKIIKGCWKENQLVQIYEQLINECQ